MATSTSDKFITVAPLYEDSLASAIADASTTTATVTSGSTNLTNGQVYGISFVSVSSSSGSAAAVTLYETAYGIWNSALKQFTSLLRGQEGIASAHPVGRKVVIFLTASIWNKLISGITTEHNQDGTHKTDIPLSNQSLSRQALINGNFEVVQRGTSLSLPSGVTPAYLIDRWNSYAGGSPGTATISQQAFALGQTDVPGNPKYYLRHNQTAGASTYQPFLGQKIEGVEHFAGQKVTLSLYVKCNSGTITINPAIQQVFGTGGSPSAIVNTTPDSGGNITATTTWTKFVRTFTLPPIAGKTLGSTAGTDYLFLCMFFPLSATYILDFAEAQLCAGDVALPFMPKSYHDELLACKRYCRVIGGDSLYEFVGSCYANTTSQIFATVPLDPAMRTVPALESVSGTWQSVTGVDATGIAMDGIGYSSSKMAVLSFSGLLGLGVGDATPIRAKNSLASKIVLAAELP